MAAFWVFVLPGRPYREAIQGPVSGPCLSGDLPVAVTILRRVSRCHGLAPLCCRED